MYCGAPNNTKPKSEEKVIEKMENCDSGVGTAIFSIFHIMLSLVAIYMSFRCNKGFDFGSFLAACCCPYIYVIYVLATKGTCGVIPSESIMKL